MDNEYKKNVVYKIYMYILYYTISNTHKHTHPYIYIIYTERERVAMALGIPSDLRESEER